MTDITELAQREKFEAWFKSSFHPDKTGPYIKDQLYFAWKAAGAELVEVLEKAQAKNALVAGGIEAAAKLHEQIACLKSENAALKGSVENAAGCINAAYAEGLIDLLAESSDERLVDLVKRRLLHAYLPVETPATDDLLVAMGDAVLLEQLEDSRKAIVSQSYIIDLQDKRNVELDSHKAALLKFISDSCYIFDGFDADISDAYVDAITSGLMPKLESVTACNPPLFWVRVKSDGGYEGPIHDSKLEDVRKKSGEWLPLTLARGVHELESRTVTVKLPERYACELGYNAPDPNGDMLDRDDVIAALTDAGIKVEAE